MVSVSDVHSFLEVEWLKKLYAEYDQIVYQYQLRLRKPLLQIRDLSGQWGQWDPLTHTLTISKQLILSHEWQHVIGVLKHEMAHQFVSEIFKGDSGHGADFKKACDALGLSEEYRSAGLDLGEPLRSWRETSAIPKEDEAILRKVEKLLAMAESANENEAFLAMARVRDLFHKYNVEFLMNKKNARYVSLVINHKKKKIDRLQQMIASLLTGYYFVEVIFSEDYDAYQNQSHKTMEILGSQQNVLMAEYVYGFLRQQSESLWQSYRTARSLKGVGAKMSFQAGVISGFRKKLESMEAGRAKQSQSSIGLAELVDGMDQTALVKFKDPGLRNYVRFRFPRLRSFSSGGRVQTEHYNKGRVQGEKIVIHRGVHQSGGNRGTLLGPARS